MGSPPFINEIQERSSKLWDRLRASSENNTSSAFTCAIAAIKLASRKQAPEAMAPLFLAFEVLLGALFTEAIANASDRNAVAQRLLPLRREARKALLAVMGPEAAARLRPELDEPGKPVEREELEDLEYRLGLLEAQALKLLEAATSQGGNDGKPTPRR